LKNLSARYLCGYEFSWLEYLIKLLFLHFKSFKIGLIPLKKIKNFADDMPVNQVFTDISESGKTKQCINESFDHLEEIRRL
jgi:hypothetical protein